MSTCSNIVVSTCLYVTEHSEFVGINDTAIESLASKITEDDLKRITSPQAFDPDLHYIDGTALTAQYLLVLDALNFCFWPDGEMQYSHLSKGLKACLEANPHALDADKLSSMTGPTLRHMLCWPRELPLEEERARLVREVGVGLLADFEGEAANLIKAANRSAMRLVELVTRHFPGFRDHAVYRGKQVFLYKRAQIFAGDVFGAFNGQGIGEFHDISALTMFADYRVPVVLRQMDVLQYNAELERKVESKVELPPGGQEEVEIRAATIIAVEKLRDVIQAQQLLKPKEEQILPHVIQLDWWLWEWGERNRQVDPPHHRTLTIFY